MNNNEQNNVVPNNQTNTSTGINVPNVMPPTVAPPTVNSGANFASDGRILKPITPVEPVPEVTPEQNAAEQPVVEQPTPEQAQVTPLPNVIVDSNGEAKDEVNTTTEVVEIEKNKNTNNETVKKADNTTKKVEVKEQPRTDTKNIIVASDPNDELRTNMESTYSIDIKYGDNFNIMNLEYLHILIDLIKMN